MNKKILISLIPLLLFASCYTQSGSPKYIKNGRQYGITDGTFRNKWWNYYERGLSFLDGEFYTEAISDLNQAIKQRSKDQRRARTYGIHFVDDYFPHRELGIALLRTGFFEDAVKELESSLAFTESAKAKYFLNEARRKLLIRNRSDKTPPRINIISPLNNSVTNKFEITVKGYAEDDTYIKSININGKPIRIELSGSKIDFERNVPLEPGINNIIVRSSDLTGKSTETAVSINADREGPIVSIEDIKIEEVNNRFEANFSAFAYDNSSILSFIVNGKDVLTGKKSNEAEIFCTFNISSRNETISFEASDVIGNVTKGTINNETFYRSSAGQHYAFLGTILPAVSSSQSYPVINLKDFTDSQSVFYDRAVLEGNIVSPYNVTFISINGEPIIRRKGKNLYFHHLTKLKKGINNIVIQATDGRSSTQSKKIIVERKIPEVRDIGSRMSISILPFEKKGSSSFASNAIYDSLINSLQNLTSGGDVQRFNIVERSKLDEVLKEQKLSQTAIADPETAARIGKIIAAESILMGSIVENKDSIDIFARLVNTETGAIMAANDVFDEDKSLSGIKNLSEGLALKFGDNFPLLEGMVIKVDADKIFTDLGTTTGIRKGIKVILFKEGEKIIHPLTGKVLGSDTEILGEAVINQAEDDFSKAEIIKKNKTKTIAVKNGIITK